MPEEDVNLEGTAPEAPAPNLNVNAPAETSQPEAAPAQEPSEVPDPGPTAPVFPLEVPKTHDGSLDGMP